MTETSHTRTDVSARPDQPADGGFAAIKGILAGRLRPLWVTGAIVWGAFTTFRLGLLLARLDGLHGVGPSELARCFLLGMRYDAMPTGYLLLPMAMALSLVPKGAFARRGFRNAITVFGTAVVLIVLATEIIGAAFYLHFGLRLNWMALYYLQYPQEVLVFISENYPLWLFVIIIAALVYGGYRLLGRLFWGKRTRDFSLRLPGRLAGAAILAGLGVLACRGGMDHRPLGRGSAYISYNNLVNQLTLNNFFTFFNALEMQITDSRDETRWYPLPTRRDAVEKVREMLFDKSRDQPIGPDGNGLWRRSTSAHEQIDWNVVLILMEGMAGDQVGALGRGTTCTPNLDALCKKGVFFSNMHAVGARTSRGIMGTLCGHPDIGGQTILKRRRGMTPFLTLPTVVRRRGYDTMFIYGGDPRFDNMKTFLAAHGMDVIIGQDEIDPDKAGNWGVPDEYIFDKAHSMFSQAHDKPGRPFFACILTVSNHEPYEVPDGPDSLEKPKNVEAKIRNAYRYADWALGQFFKQAEQDDTYFKRTIFVMVADHGVRLDHRPLLDAPGYRVPCVIYAPGLTGGGKGDARIPQPARIETLCSQADLPQTVMAMLGGSYDHCFLGRDILAVKPGDGFAFMHEDDRLALIRGRHVLVLPPLCDPILYDKTPGQFERVRSRHTRPDEVHELKTQLLSYYMIAREMYLASSYRPPADANTGPRPSR